MNHFRYLLTAAVAVLLPLIAQAQQGYPTYAATAQPMAAPAYPVASMPTCSSCSSGGQSSGYGSSCQSCGKHGWGGKLKAWFGYKDCGVCPRSCHACKYNCSTPLYLWFLRDCAYRPSSCCGHGGHGDDFANPPYSRSVFPVGHMMGAQPMGMPGGCGVGGCH